MDVALIERPKMAVACVGQDSNRAGAEQPKKRIKTMAQLFSMDRPGLRPKTKRYF